MAASAIGFCSGRTVTKETGNPKPARDTATFASPPPNVATSSGRWNNRSEPGADRRSMISPKVIVVFDILLAPGLFDLRKKLSRRFRDTPIISGFRGGGQVATGAKRNAAGANPVRRVVHRHTAGRH